MTKKKTWAYRSRRVCIGILLLLALAALVPTVSAEASGKTIKVTKAQIRKNGAYKAIQNALDRAAKKGSAKSPCTVKVASGKYNLDGELNIFSNTTLSLKGVTLKRVGKALSGTDRNMIRIGKKTTESSGKTGYCYKNITIVGGVFDGNNKTKTIIKLGHAKNVTLQDLTVKKAKNAHMVEVAGVDGLTIDGCIFKDQKLSGKQILTYEAIQLDILYKEHFTLYRSEVLPIRNVTVTNCTFKNVVRGIGSHTAVLNAPLEGITITGCTFQSLKSAAIQGQNWIDCTIEGNTITNAPRGISIYSVMDKGKGTYLPSVLSKLGKKKTKVSGKYITPSSDQKIRIADNKITLGSSDDPYASYDRTGILVAGTKITSVTKKNGDGSGHLPKGNYYISGVEISGNQISTTGYGIRLEDVRSVNVTENTIRFHSASDAKSTSYHGLHIVSGTKCTSVSRNTITGMNGHGIMLGTSAYAQSIDNNRIVSAKKYGVFLENASAKDIVSNTFQDVGVWDICIRSKGSAEKISGNSFTESNGIIKISADSTVDENQE